MADDGGHASHAVIHEVPRESSAAVRATELYELLRRLEASRPDLPRIGRTLRLAQEVVRFGQEASLAFPAGMLATKPAEPGPSEPWRVQVHGFGLLGPNGPMPLHLTEYVWRRIKHHGDHAFARFLDMFTHRMLSFFYRAWVDANPAVSFDRPGADRFQAYVGSLLGVGTAALRERDELGDSYRRYHAGRFADPVANPDGLCALIEDGFGIPARVEEFIGEWADIPGDCLWRLPDPSLGPAATSGRLGQSTNLGQRVWLTQGRFRVVLGPLDRRQFNQVAPDGSDVKALVALIRGYAGDTLRWDLRLTLHPDAVPTLQLGTARLGQTAWLWGSRDLPQDDLIYEPRLTPQAPPR